MGQRINTAVPLTVIGGFLGAGKTTLLNRVLSGNTGVRYAVMVNDFGDLSVDDSLITAHDGDTLSFANGCVCCTLGDNFMLAIDQLLDRPHPPEQILVEASGVADPRAIADVAVLHPQLRKDLTLVLADASAIRQRADDARLTETVARQLAAADLIILNKCDLVDAPLRQDVGLWLKEQTSAPQVECRHADLPLDLLQAAFEPNEDLSADDPHHHHNHGDLFKAATLRINDPIDPPRLQSILDQLPPSVLRVKGFVAASDGRNYLLQWSGGTGELHDHVGEIAQPYLVTIGTADMPDKNSLERLFAGASHAADH